VEHLKIAGKAANKSYLNLALEIVTKFKNIESLFFTAAVDQFLFHVNL